MVWHLILFSVVLVVTVCPYMHYMLSILLKSVIMMSLQQQYYSIVKQQVKNAVKTILHCLFYFSVYTAVVAGVDKC